jgi:hypothetical protein
VLSFFLSSVAFVVAGWYIRRYLENIGIPKTMLRGFVVFVLALAVAYGVAALVDAIAG